MKKSSSILLLATERSGTNLVRAILSTHSKISSPPPFSMVDLLASDHYKYINPFQSYHLDELIQDVIELSRSHLHAWDVNIDIDDIKRRLGDISFWEVFRVMNEIYADSESKNIWMSKEPGLFKHIYEIALQFPDAKFIYLVRDPRDVVSSMLKGGLHENHAFYAASRWKHEQGLSLNALSTPSLKNRIFFLRYEDLIGDSKVVVKNLMQFLDLNFEIQQLEFYNNEAVKKHSSKSEFWQNLAKPIDSGNKANYLRYLTEKQVSLIESIVWDEMKILGYCPTISKRKNINVMQRIIFKLISNIKKRTPKINSSDELQRHKRRIESFKRIRNRTFN